MSFDSLLKQTADIYRPSVDAPTGPEARSQWSDTPTYSGVRCRVQIQQVAELDKGTAATVFKTLAFFRYAADVLEGDRVVVDGVRYDVEGVDGDVAGAGHHKQVQLRAVR